MNLKERDKMKIAVIRNCFGAVVGAIERDRWTDYCDIITDGDGVFIFEGDTKIEEMSGAEFKRLYGGGNE